MTFTTPAPKRPSFTGGARTNGRPTPTAAERREIEDDIRRDRIAQHGPEMIALIAEAKAFRKTCGSYTVDGWLFDAIYGIHLTQIDEDRIRAGMSATIAKCQSARNIDPLSASNIDPLMMIVGAGRTPELVRVAQAFGPRGEMVRLCS